jgi:hypothetical protein
MGILKRAGDLVYTLRFLRLLTTPFEETKAFKLGIIDEKGKRNKDVRVDSTEERDAYTPFHRLVFNIKKVLEKVPGGGTTIGSYAAALYLIKEKFSINDKQILEGIAALGGDTEVKLAEGRDWFVLEDGRLSPGRYKVRNSKVLNLTCEELVNAKDVVVVGKNAYPIGDILGIDIYEATHFRTGQTVYVTVGELLS